MSQNQKELFSVHCSFQDLCMVSCRPSRDWVGTTANSSMINCKCLKTFEFILYLENNMFAVVSISCKCCCCHSSRCFTLVSWENKCSLVQQWIWWWSADWWFHYQHVPLKKCSGTSKCYTACVYASCSVNNLIMWFFQEIVTCTCSKSYSLKLNMLYQVRHSPLIFVVWLMYLFIYLFIFQIRN